MSDVHVRAFEIEMGITIDNFKRGMARNGIFVYLGKYMREGWRGKLPFYLFKCETHGLVVDYPHGYSQRRTCPICVKESL